MPFYGPGTPWHDRKSEAEKARKTQDLEANTLSQYSYQQQETGYVRTGRGGAGNYTSDPTASKPDTDASSVTQVASANTTYGRGGSGNYTSAAERTGDQFVSEPDADTPIARGGNANRTYGRGGSGNYVAAAEEGDARAAESQAQLHDRLQLDIEKGVEAALAMPAKAKLPLSSPRDANAPT